jgi:hypothetical protein
MILLILRGNTALVEQLKDFCIEICYSQEQQVLSLNHILFFGLKKEGRIKCDSLGEAPVTLYRSFKDFIGSVCI